jgi:hypothetical protein
MNALVCTTALHLALKSDPASWSALPLIGVQSWEAFEDEPAGAIELRNCPHCGSTMAMERAS